MKRADTAAEGFQEETRPARARLLAVAFCLLLPAGFARAAEAPARTAPYLLDVARPAEVELRARVEKAIAAPIVTVVEKSGPSPSGDPHDYVSYARYWWPDPEKGNGLPYIQRDGHHNLAQVAKGDAGRYWELVDVVETLALGWGRWHREDCARRAGDWLRTWLVAPATRMTPSLEYSQIRLGHDYNHGSSSGVLDGRGSARVVDALQLLDDSPALSAADREAIRHWFSDYLAWLTTSRNGRAEHAAPNNHGSWYLVQAIAISRYLGRDDDARRFAEEDRARIAAQFAEDGSQPKELTRTDSLHYSAFNLEAQLQVAILAAPLGVDLWRFQGPKGSGLQKGLAFLRPFNDAPEKWPHHELQKKAAGFLQPVIDLATRLSAPTRG